MNEERAGEREAVEVVGYLLTKGNQLSLMPAGSSDLPLMTVAQHQRILADMRQQRDKLARVLENVEREHELIRQMKNCEIRRGRGSFGIAVMSDTPAVEWQAFDKELQQLIDARRDTLAAPAAGQATVKDPLTVRPSAYAVFADNGNVICFSTQRDHQSLVKLEEEGKAVVALGPVVPASAGHGVSALVEALERNP